ncbi:unnamed protein product [Rotaria magnacalcarata]|uniref:Protein kinase domain-containing protein n=2 Tax=Rotaria magnacalcarata TaxID=392030 RepID=A0A816SV21_9BILA|nr:unnamed protein product [Rotaria magnacalcarata]CAF2148967.1 unnamed protein product [Rotaria magnacalcarata]
MQIAASELDFYEASFRRVPMNSATTQKDIIDFTSIATSSTYNLWGKPLKRAVSTKNIDGNTIFGRFDRSNIVKDLFPRGRSLQRPINSADTKMNARGAYMSLLPVDPSTVRAQKIPSPLSMATGKQAASLPELPQKHVTTRNTRLPSATIIDDNSDAKLYARCATTYGSGAWIRRYKSINVSQTFSDLLRDETNREKILLKKRSYQQLLTFSSASSSTSSFNSSLIKRKRNKINEDSYGVDDEEEFHELDMTGRVIANNYRIESKLGAGSFGQVYLCEHVRTHEQWAMKIESHAMNNNPQLSIEHKIYTILQGAIGFPKIDYFGSEGTYDVLIIELLGPSLEDLFNYCHRKFTLKTALMLVDQMVSRIEYVHTCHLIHRDIKPGLALYT